jgi:hypothetical protein
MELCTCFVGRQKQFSLKKTRLAPNIPDRRKRSVERYSGDRAIDWFVVGTLFDFWPVGQHRTGTDDRSDER